MRDFIIEVFDHEWVDTDPVLEFGIALCFLSKEVLNYHSGKLITSHNLLSIKLYVDPSLQYRSLRSPGEVIPMLVI